MRLPAKPPDSMKVIQEASPKEISALMQSEEYLKLAHLCEVEYWPWDKFRFKARHQTKLAWALVANGRLPRYRHLPLDGHGKANLKYTLPDAVQKELMLIDQELAGRVLSDDHQPLIASQREQFIVASLREEAISSSLLEGAVTTRQEAERMLKSGRKPRSNGEQMVMNNYRAIMFIREHYQQELTPEFLIEVQRILTEGTLEKEDQVGRLRTAEDNIRIVDERDQEIVHQPPPAEELEQRIAVLCRFANRRPEEEPFIHPVISACVLHFQVGFDHPFCDGNGRTARALFYWLMLRRGYWLFEYLPISRLIYRSPGQYARAFLYSEIEDFDLTYFLLYKMRIISRARRDLHAYLREKYSQMTQARRMFSSDRRLNHRQRSVVLQATNHPDRVFTIADHQSKFAVSYGTARNDLLALSRWGYLEMSVVGKTFEFVPGDRLTELNGE